jgi:hypothetical protein
MGRARLGSATGGLTASRGTARAARQAGTNPAVAARATATGATSRVRRGDSSRDRAFTNRKARAVPATPAARPTTASSPKTARKILPLPHPRHSRVPISVLLDRTEAKDPLARNNPETTSTSTNRARDLRSRAETMAKATPFLVHPSFTVRAGRPNFPAGRSTSRGWGEDPAVMSTASPVSSTMACATRRTRSLLTGSGPVTPATRTRITLMGALGLEPS